MPAVLTPSDNGGSFKLRVGGDAVLQLPENASTGYRWAVDSADTALVEVKEGDSLSTSKAVGAGGEAQFQIEAKASGTAHVKLKRWRPWEGDSSVVERYEVTFEISP